MFSARTIFCAVLTAAPAAFAVPQAAFAACLPVKTAQDLDHIRTKLDGQYCLLNDLDLTGKNLSPIGDGLTPFTGSFDGGGHVIRRLRVKSANALVGLFGQIDGGTVSDVTLAGVLIQSSKANALVGALVGQAFKATIRNVRVTGSLHCTGTVCRMGALVGEAEKGVTITLSSAYASVWGGDGGAAGGLVGQSDGRIAQSYSTGDVTCGSNCAAGGLVGFAGSDSAVVSSFSTGTVRGIDNGAAGGLIGTNYGLVSHSYETGDVRVHSNAIIGGLIGYHGGKVVQCFAIGQVSASKTNTIGGLIGALAAAQASSQFAYWDLDVSHRGASAQGQSRTTVQLQAALQTGFDSSWGITKGYGYPFQASATFASTLATITKPSEPFVFVPVEQLEPTEYKTAPAHADKAALATVYTMIGRAVGETHHHSALTGIKIDRYFWDDAKQKATWTGPVMYFAALSGVRNMASGASIDDSNIIGSLKARNAVILRGRYTAENGKVTLHWMLATSFTSDGSGQTTGLVANDPWTGQQVRIDPTTHMVTQPAKFPLTNFRVDGYQVVTLQ